MNKIFGYSSIAMVALAAIVGLNSYTTVESGYLKTASLFGEILEGDDKLYEEGFNWVNPMYNLETWPIREQVYELENVSIPAQDKFKSTIDISVKYSLNPDKIRTLRTNVGDFDTVKKVLLDKPLLSFIREAGKGIQRSQDLFNDEVQQKINSFIMEKLRSEVEDYGINVINIYIKDINLPPVITSMINTTKRLEEEEAQEQARLNKEALVYQRQEKEAESEAHAAASRKESKKHDTDAEFYEKQKRADGAYYQEQKEADAILYRAKKQAEANKALSSSIDDRILKMKQLDVEMQKAQSWNGSVPQTLLGGEGNNSSIAPIVPVYQLNK